MDLLTQRLGLSASRLRDGAFRAPNLPHALQREAQDLHVRQRQIWSPFIAWLRANKTHSFISENPVVAKIQYWMKITFIFILILFIDSVNRVYRVQVELAAASEQAKQGGGYVTPRN